MGLGPKLGIFSQDLADIYLYLPKKNILQIK